MEGQLNNQNTKILQKLFLSSSRSLFLLCVVLRMAKTTKTASITILTWLLSILCGIANDLECVSVSTMLRVYVVCGVLRFIWLLVFVGVMFLIQSEMLTIFLSKYGLASLIWYIVITVVQDTHSPIATIIFSRHRWLVAVCGSGSRKPNGGYGDANWFCYHYQAPWRSGMVKARETVCKLRLRANRGGSKSSGSVMEMCRWDEREVHSKRIKEKTPKTDLFTFIIIF